MSSNEQYVMFVQNVLEGKPFEALLPVHVDVRDVARAHILAAQNPAAKVRRWV